VIRDLVAEQTVELVRPHSLVARLAPREPNPYDSMGEAYLHLGMPDRAVESYSRALAVDHTFVPKKGQAVIWNNLNPDGTPNAATLHSGEPVTSGHKIIITKWFRELGSGPMFYED